MRERPENLVRNAGPLLAAALCVWGAASFADELPDSVRERALQELRVLDRGTSHPAPDVSRAAQTSNASRRTAPSAAMPHASPAKSATTAAAPVPAEPIHSSAPIRQSSADAFAETAADAKSPTAERPAMEITPGGRSARATIVRPSISSQPRRNPIPGADSLPGANPSNNDVTISAGRQPVPLSEPSFDGAKPPFATGLAEPSEETAPAAASPFAEVLNEEPGTSAEANPFDSSNDTNGWRPAETEQVSQKVAAPETKPPMKHELIPATMPPQVKKKLVSSQTSITGHGKSDEKKSEQIGADHPVSVLDFLARGVPDSRINEPAHSVARKTSSPGTGNAAASEPVAAPTVELHAAAVANGLPRSVEAPVASHHPLESVNESEARLETPPEDLIDVARQDETRSEQQKLEERSGRDGLMGFCPVTLRDQKTLVDGRSEFTSHYGGETFELATAEAKAAFDAEPERYSPANAGRDIVLQAGQIDVSGSLKHATYYRNRLYLFRSAQTCRLFESDPARYVAENGSSVGR